MADDKTKWIFDDSAGRQKGGGDFTENISPPGSLGGYGDQEKTRRLKTDEATVIFNAGNAGRIRTDYEYAEETDPPVGCLMVIRGPGRGRVVNVGIGMNSIGRDPGERVPLPFGDTLISSKDHAKIIYDDSTRAYYIAHGSGKNITRLNGAIVANPVPLENHAIIHLTKVTHLRFVAFCGPDFDWSDLDRKDDGETS